MRYNQLKEREIFKRAKYIKYVDANGNPVGNESAIKSAPILFFQRIQGDGLLVKLSIYDAMPDGYKSLYGVLATPAGFRWIYNGKSMFGSLRRKALLRVN